MNTDKVYLVGFMGAGKSSVGARLARRLDFRFEDIDRRIEARERRAIAAIFKQAGEPYFRGLERAELSMLVPDRHLVVATGGGTFVDPENRAVMLADGAVAWLDLPFSDVLARLPTDGRRPLAADRAQLEQLYLVREGAYREAHFRIDSSRPLDEVVEGLLDWLGF